MYFALLTSSKLVQLAIGFEMQQIESEVSHPMCFGISYKHNIFHVDYPIFVPMASKMQRKVRRKREGGCTRRLATKPNDTLTFPAQIARIALTFQSSLLSSSLVFPVRRIGKAHFFFISSVSTIFVITIPTFPLFGKITFSVRPNSSVTIATC